ncbi:amidoligase family protein [Myxococcus sp. K15C18031901]|uniref:amidoligase family protein n=1 Tax=Myxococcus dinghuensis TaxID=2906761 RepID=UPI0020A73D30|nr:amidoligase family protein [Myxococcus dinghuensis]MCP3104238.1 amidoligase family protein [Myxococcus dinghuensis]
MKTLRFGIEIETVGADRQQLTHAIRDAVGGHISSDFRGCRVTDSRGRIWRVVPDASLSGGMYSGEIVSPVLTYEDMETLQAVVRAAREAGAYADTSTGIHIHVDGSRFDAQSVTNLVKMVHKQERLLETALGVSATRLARYCKPIDAAFLQRLEARRPRTLQDVNAAWYGRRINMPDRYDQSRYHGLNLNSLFFRGTIEFRYFNGSVHAGEVKAYVQLVLALAARALASKAASSKRRDFNPATAKYDFRVFLLHLGLIGEEFKTARLHLLKKLEGSAAWKGQRRDRRGSGGGEDGSPGSEGSQGDAGAAPGNTPTEARAAA